MPRNVRNFWIEDTTTTTTTTTTRCWADAPGTHGVPSPDAQPSSAAPAGVETAVVETVDARIARLGLTEISQARMEALKAAHAMGAAVDDALFRRLGDATRLGRRSTVVLPAHRFEHLSRGRGWARKGTGESVTWGKREDGGYRVGPGRWTVGGHDGFTRQGSASWQVEHVQVGSETWTVAR